MSDDLDSKSITETVQLYFNGTFQGDNEKLKRAFHPQARITGFVNDELVDWSLSDFITRATQSPTAAAKGEDFDKKILSIDKTLNTAVVKARVKVGPLFFTDYISLLKINGEWIIRHKSFTTA